MRKVTSIEVKETGRKVSIYRNAEWNEWVVKFYVDGVHQVDADYHTDKEDAYSTASNWVNKPSQLQQCAALTDL
jgi:hypothetical protein